MTIQIRAYFDKTEASPMHAAISYNLTEEQVAALPKSLKLKSTNGHFYQFVIKFKKDGVIGDKNETGIKRIHKLFEAGAEFTTSEFTSNAYRSKAAFLAAL